MNYKNCRCIVCNEQFKDGDDIVVCPECATPYHRECYKKNNKCINIVLHEKKKVWKPDNITENQTDELPEDSAQIICDKCSFVNKSSSKFCENCGETLVNSSNISPNDEQNKELSEKLNFFFDGEFPDTNSIQFDGIKSKEIASFIGRNIFYYLAAFSRMKKQGKNISFNLLCFFVPYYYFANRKMYLWAFISFVIMTLLSIPEMMNILASQLAFPNTEFLESGIFNAFLNTSSFLMILFRVVIAFFANSIYYKHIIKSIRNIKETYPMAEWSEIISHKGGTCFPAVLITVLIELLSAMALMFILSLFMLLF